MHIDIKMAGADTMDISPGSGVEETKTSGESKRQTTTNANAAMVRFQAVFFSTCIEVVCPECCGSFL